MKNRMTIYLMRHGKTMLNESNSVQGWADSPLTPQGERESEYAGIGLKEIAFDRVYTSDSGRTIQTARHVLKENNFASKLGITPTINLREVCFGQYEGRASEKLWEDVLIEEIEENDINNVSIETFVNHIASFDLLHSKNRTSWPAENYAQLSKRLKFGFIKLAQESLDEGNENILVVSHGISIMTLLTELMVFPVNFNHMPENNSVTKINFDGETFDLVSYNETSFTEIGQKSIEG